MKLEQIEKVAIVGAGTMGTGMAQVFAAAGYKTILYDRETLALERARTNLNKSMEGMVERGKMSAVEMAGILHLIDITPEFYALKADLIIEAIVEKAEVKIELFNQLALENEATTILGTNTSSIPITSIAAGVPHPERVVGIHFFNPAHIMKLVEIISGEHTSPEIAATAFDLIKKVGKTPVMAKDSPGFIVNRVARHFYVEGLKILEENVADLQTIDRLAEASGFKMGPFKLMDLIGVDTNFSVTSSMFESFHYDGKFRPSRIQELKVKAGHWGRKTGKGFYDYS